MSYSSVLTIAELDSSGQPTLRLVTLVGPSLPLMEAEWSGENNLVTTWYPGNPDEGTQQNLGPREMPSTWRGDWRRTMMGSCPTPVVDDSGSGVVVDPSVLRDLLEGVFRSGRRLRVTWATTQQPDGVDAVAYPIQGSLVREGRAKSWKFTHRSIFDIQWEITFDWVSRGASTPRVTSTRDDTLGQASAPYVASIQDLVDAAGAATTLNLAPSSFTLGQLESVSSGPLALMGVTATAAVGLQNDIVAVASIGSVLPNQPVQIAQAALGHAADALARSQEVYAAFSATPLEVQSANDDAASLLQAFALTGPVSDAALRAEIQAYVFYQKMRAALPTHSPALSGRNLGPSNPGPTTIVGVYLVRDGDTPQRISMRFYRTPDHAADIMRANGLAWHTTVLPKGKQLVIPVISSSTQTV